jgi:hypothetical protein
MPVSLAVAHGAVPGRYSRRQRYRIWEGKPSNGDGAPGPEA